MNREKSSEADVGLACAAGNGEACACTSVSPGDPASLAVRAALARCAREVSKNEPAARRAEPEGVHRMRAAARRLRGELRAFRPLVVADWAGTLTDELRWLGRTLGDARDLDVLRARLREAAGDLAEPLMPLFTLIDERQAEARARLDAALDADRYRTLLDRLDVSANQPELTDEATEPCRSALPPLVAAVWRTLKKGGRALGPDTADEEFHRVRKRAKRARYAAEAVASALPRRPSELAARFARGAQRIQDVLGRHQDAVEASRFVERAAAEQPLAAAYQLAAGRLIERQILAAREARDEFPHVWKQLDRERLCKWMDD